MALLDHLKISLSALATVLSAMALACASADGSEPGRVEARTGQIVLDSEMDDFNFSVELPEGWEAREWFQWQPERPATGWVGLPQRDNPELHDAFVQWSASDEWDSGVLRRARDDESAKVEELAIEGVRVRLVYPDTLAEKASEFRWLGAVFDSLPGAPPGQPAIPLTFSSGLFLDSQLDTIVQIIKSVRYAEPHDPPEPPAEAASPGPDWIKLQPVDFDGYAPRRSPRFVATVPPGTTGRVFPTYDTIGVALQVGELAVSGGRGQADIIVNPPDPQPGVTLWRKQVADVWGYFWQKTLDDGSFGIGVHYPRLPATPADGVRDPTSTALTLMAESVPENRLAEVLAMFESIRYAD